MTYDISKKIVTTNLCPPIPTRDCDWGAYWDDFDGDEYAPRGFGQTESEAVFALLQSTIDNDDLDDVASAAFQLWKLQSGKE